MNRWMTRLRVSGGSAGSTTNSREIRWHGIRDFVNRCDYKSTRPLSNAGVYSGESLRWTGPAAVGSHRLGSPAAQNFPPRLGLAPGFITDPLKVPSGSKNKRVKQRAEDSTGHLHRYTGAHLQHAVRRWLTLWIWARCPEGSGPCSPCCHRTSHRLRRWRMFLRTCSRWVQPHTHTHTLTWWWWCWWWWSVKGKVAFRWALLSPGRRAQNKHTTHTHTAY